MTLFNMSAGLILLILGAELLVRGASRLAAAAGIPSLVIGLTVVAFGTSSPELAVSIKSSMAGQTDIAVGNVVGSNIFNVLFILGLSALITPLAVSQQLIRLDVPVMIAVSLLALLMGGDGCIGRLDGIILFSGLIVYTVALVLIQKKGRGAPPEEFEREYPPIRSQSGTRFLIDGILVAAGLALLVFGSRWFVDGAVEIARIIGVNDLVVGLTIVAAGTSLPEVATSVIAALRGERDIAVGNVVGSNIFNILGVLGLSGVLAHGGIGVSTAAEGFDIPVMTAVAVACLPVFFTGNRIARWEGALFFGYYILYTMYIVLYASQHDSLPLFSLTMLYFVIPITVLTLVVVSVRSIRGRAVQ